MDDQTRLLAPVADDVEPPVECDGCGCSLAGHGAIVAAYLETITGHCFCCAECPDCDCGTDAA